MLPRMVAAEGGEEHPESGLLDGVSVQTLTPQLRQELNLRGQATGVVVTGVSSESPAGAAGLRKGDVIQEANRKPVTNTQDLQAAISQAGQGAVLLRVNRNGNSVFVAVESR